MIDTQQAVTLGIVAAAAGSLAHRLWRTASNKGGGHCAGCGECGKPPRPDVRPAPKATPLVTLGGVGERPPRFRPPQPGA